MIEVDAGQPPLSFKPWPLLRPVIGDRAGSGYDWLKARRRRLDSKAKGNRGNHELGFGLLNGGIVSLPPFEAPHISA